MPRRHSVGLLALGSHPMPRPPVARSSSGVSWEVAVRTTRVAEAGPWESVGYGRGLRQQAHRWSDENDEIGPAMPVLPSGRVSGPRPLPSCLHLSCRSFVRITRRRCSTLEARNQVLVEASYHGAGAPLGLEPRSRNSRSGVLLTSRHPCRSLRMGSPGVGNRPVHSALCTALVHYGLAFHFRYCKCPSATLLDRYRLTTLPQF